MQTNYDRANTTPARPVLPADFGAWKVTHSGIFNKVAQYEIPDESLWDGPLSGGPFHDSWEHHLRHKQWMRPGDYADLIAALSYARRVFAALRPQRVPPAIVEPIDAADPLAYWRKRGCADDAFPHAEFTCPTSGAAFRAERFAENTFTLFISGKAKQTHKTVRLMRRKNGNYYLFPLLPPRWRYGAMMAVRFANDAAQEGRK